MFYRENVNENLHPLEGIRFLLCIFSGSVRIDFRFAARFTASKRSGDTSDLFWLTDEQMARLKPFRVWKASQQGRLASVVAHLNRGHEEPDRAAIGVGNGMQFSIHAALCATDQTAFLAAWLPFRPQAGRRAVRLEIGRVYHNRLRDGGLSGQPVHHSSEDPPRVPPLPAVVEGL